MGRYLLRVLTQSSGAIIAPRKRYRILMASIYVISFECFSKVMQLHGQVDALKGSLNCKGERERALHKQLEKFYGKIW